MKNKINLEEKRKDFFTYKNQVYDFYYTFNDLNIVEKYDMAERKMLESLNDIEKQNYKMVEHLKEACSSICIFIDEVLGKNTCNKVLGTETQPAEIIKFKNTLVKYVANRMKAENEAVENK